MKIKDMNLPLVFLNPGEVCITEKPVLVKTILGSCVAVTLFEPVRRIAAICHGMLPECGGKGCGGCHERLKFVTCSIEHLLDKMRERGVKIGSLQVKVFGGGDVLLNQAKSVKATVGRQNIEAAMRVLSSFGLTPLTSDLGGNRGRKIFFNTETGTVMLKKLRKTTVDNSL
ncbi:MAG: chemotaxis protein CheD [Candidatus Magnetominusculus sp. LBB02]|nr:chemotaxis protein CheD [Candidatus Magnetominusculus sp. LBB02]